jgi:hypothetical protein
MKTTIYLLLSIMLVACGGESQENIDLNGDGLGDSPGSVTQIALVHPESSLSGYVFDQSSGQALDEVQVSVYTGLRSHVASSASGVVEISGLPAGGSAMVSLSKDGFISARVIVELPDDAGNFPSSTNHATFGLIGLLPATTLTSTVFDEQLVGTSGVTVSLEFPYSFTQGGAAKGGLSLVSSSDDTGQLRFAGAPALSHLGASSVQLGGAVTLHIHADDENRGETVQTPLSELVEMGRLPLLVRKRSEVLHTLRQNGALRMVHSNLRDLVQRRQHIAPLAEGTPIRILFDRPIDPSSLYSSLVDESGDASLNLEPQFSSGGRLITLSPALGSLAAGAEYNLSLRAFAASDEDAGWMGNANILTSSNLAAPFSDEDYSVTWDDHNLDGQINGGDDLVLEADLPIGRRLGNGQSGLGSVLAQFAFVAPLDAENSVLGESDYEINGIPNYPNIVLIEEYPGQSFALSGYTRKLRLRLPAAADFSANIGISVRLVLIFDNPYFVLPSNQVKMPNGEALSRYTIRVALP